MAWLSRIRSMFRSLFCRHQLEQELDREVSSYVELLAEQKAQQGLGREEALRQARIELGGATQVKEGVRRVRLGAWLGTLWQDLVYGARILRKNPGFTAVAVLIFAIGIGANTTIFSMANVLVLRALPGVERPDRLLYVIQKHEYWGNTFSYPDFQDVRQQTGDYLADLAATQPFQMDGLSLDGRTQSIWTAYVTTNFFRLMGVRPALGTLITEDSGGLIGSSPVLVVSYDFWQTHLGGDPDIVGKQARVNGHLVTIIGVAGQGFHGGTSFTDTQGYLPLAFAQSLKDAANDNSFADREVHQLFLYGRLRDGVSLAKADSGFAVVANRLANAYPKLHKGLIIRPILLGSGFINSTGENPLPLISVLFLTLAGLLLALAAANVVNLLLVRALARGGEMAVRSALGATRARLVRQMLAEASVLALLACAGGILTGLAASRAVSSIPLHTDIPFLFDFSFDWRVFSYALAATVGVGMLIGLATAWQASRVNLNDALQGSARNISPRRQRLRTCLVVGQVAGSLMLLIVAGLFVRSLRNVQHADLGFDPDGVMNFTMEVHQAGLTEAQGREFYSELLARSRALPGVEAASLAQVVAIGLFNKGAGLKIEGYQDRPGQPKPGAAYNAVSPEYFRVMVIPVLSGRGILESDTANSPHVAVINQAMAERYWPGENPIGRQFTQTEDPSHVQQIVGVFKNARMEEMNGPIGPFFFMPISQNYASLETLQIRTSGSPSTVVKPVLDVVHSLQPALPVGDVQTMNQVLDGPNGLLLYRLGAGMAGALGLLGLFLAMIGLYGVVSYSTAQRTHEIGIRMALGALPSQVVNPILRQGLFIVACGLVLGVLAAAAIAKLAGSFLVGVSPIDPLTYVGVSVLLAAAALLASGIPARRATKVDPTVALRHE